MSIHSKRARFLNFKAASSAVEANAVQRQFEDIFPDIVIAENDEEDRSLQSAGNVKSISESFSSSYDSEEEKKLDAFEANQNVARIRKAKYRKSILKSQILTNKRQSVIKQSFNTRKTSTFKND